MSKTIYTEIIPYGDSPVLKIRVSVDVEDDTEFFHPAHFATAARYFASDQEKTASQFSNAFGPYKDIHIGA